MKRISLLLLIALSATSLFADQASEQALRRFAMFVGSNDGGHQRVRLKYAESDARAMAGLMQELGGVTPEDSLVLLAPTSSDLEAAFHKVGASIRRAHEQARRVEFLLYYSGHSDEQGLLLGEERVDYADLKEAVQGVQADVNIAILDSCFSGAFTRLKGGSRQAPFMLDESVQMKGHAFLTSSSADESAQESDHIQGSFFTHYLIAGLRGAADATRDEQISLNEAYHYAFSETLARTETSQAGAQHPSYNIQLTGTGDLTITDLRAATSGVLLLGDLEGRLYVRGATGNLIAEIRKNPDIPVLLALPAGRYSLTLDREGRSFVSSLLLRSGERQSLGFTDFQPTGRERTYSRGDQPAENNEEGTGSPSETSASEPAGELPVSHAPFVFSVLPSMEAGGGERTVYSLSLNLLVGSVYGIRGAQLSTILGSTKSELSGVQASGVGNTIEGDLLGVQYAGVFNIVEGKSKAVQYAGVFNTVEGEGSYLQAAGVFNTSGESFTGAQAAGVFNINEGKLSGVQMAGVFNMEEGPLAGAQVAGVFNSAAKVSGAQVGVVNIGQDVDGTQIGLVNIAAGQVRGTQIGLVNISRDLYGIPIGLINVVEEGIFHVSAWFSELGMGYLGLEMGSRYVYTLLYSGMDVEGGDSPDLYTAALGFGLHVPVGPFFVDTDLSAKVAWTGFDDKELAAAFADEDLSPVWPSARILAGVRVLDFVSIFGGILFDIYLPGRTIQSGLHQGSSFTIDFWNNPAVVYTKLFAGFKL